MPLQHRYSDALADQIIARLFEGETLTAICHGPDMPSRRSVYNWTQKRPEFGELYKTAVRAGCDCNVDRIVVIADLVAAEVRRVEMGRITSIVAAARLQIEARRFYASRRYPERYAEQMSMRDLTEGPREISGVLKVGQLGDTEAWGRRQESAEATP